MPWTLVISLPWAALGISPPINKITIGPAGIDLRKPQIALATVDTCDQSVEDSSCVDKLEND